jgi:hypothetical protein
MRSTIHYQQKTTILSIFEIEYFFNEINVVILNKAIIAKKNGSIFEIEYFFNEINVVILNKAIIAKKWLNINRKRILVQWSVYLI